jgi:hypothetical protein
MIAPAMPSPNPHSAQRTRTLSKSDFIRACDCPAKLYFRENGYPDARQNDSYLAMLADGGYMVEALAKARYPHAIQLDYGGDVASDFARTRVALETPDVTLFEATLLVGRRQARVDILEKRGNVLRVIEVKAKSFDGTEHARQLALGRSGEFLTSRRPYRVGADWKDKIADLTYQVVLLEQLMPGFVIHPVLALVDKSKAAGLDNVPGYFQLVRRPAQDGSLRLHTARFTGSADDLAQLDLVTEVDVAREVAIMHDDIAAAATLFESRLDAPFEVHTDGVELGAHCRDCEFRTPGQPRNGFAECWGDLAEARPHLLELYYLKAAKAPDGSSMVPWMLGRHSASLLEAPVEGLVQKDSNPGGTAARQRRQIEYTRLGVPYVGPEFRRKIEALSGPVHFIDFETSRLALPYHHGMRPYGLVTFQWSAHTARTLGGPLEHREWLNNVDIWPNQTFAESLRAAIGDDGPVLTWSHFEESTLKQIVADLERFGRDAPDLVRWMTDVFGRRIVDLHEWARCDYYHPGMGGRTSIKVVLEALWRSDPTMRRQCAEWSGLAEEPADDPYRALPPVEIDGTFEQVREGTGAMQAYQHMMYGEHKDDAETRERWAALLKQYCRLDTLSMVLILEHWRRAAGLA